MISIIGLALMSMCAGMAIEKWVSEERFQWWLISDVLLMIYWGSQAYLKIKGGA